jgi:SulP family sulfate permease
MIMVSIGTFSWRSIIDIRRNPPSSSLVMLATVVTVVATHDLSKGVLVGVLLSGVFFAGKVAKLFHVRSSLDAEAGIRTYLVDGQVFFASAESFSAAFDFEEQVTSVVIDVTAAHFWDITAVGALDKVVLKYRRRGIAVDVRGLNEASANMLDRFALHDKGDAALVSTGSQ